MRGCPASTNDPAGFFSGCRARLWPGVDDKQDHYSHGLPAVAVGMGVHPAGRRRVVEHQPRGFEAQAVIALAGPVLFIPPNPTHAGPVDDVTTIL